MLTLLDNASEKQNFRPIKKSTLGLNPFLT